MCSGDTGARQSDAPLSAWEERAIRAMLLGGLPVHDQPGVSTPSVFSPGFPVGWYAVVGPISYEWCWS